MPRRSNGEGSIAKRTDGRWQASLQVEGLRRTVYGKTRSEVATKLDGLRRQAAVNGTLPDTGKRCLNDLLDAWLEIKAQTVRPRTLDDYAAVCNRYLRPTLGAIPLARVTPDRIHRLYARLQGQGHHRTARLVHTVLSQTLAQAVRWTWLAHNPCERVAAPRHRAERQSPWSPEQLRRFLDDSREQWLHPLWVLLASSGCRLGEALALTWEDVGKATISVTKTIQRIGSEWVTTPPKTQAGVRTIALPPEASRALARQAEWRLAHGGGSLVFAGENGQPLQRATVSHAMRRECERLGLLPLTPHGLRHLHASLLLSEGLPLPEVSRRLGHANTGITATVYSHAVRDDTVAARAIERALMSEARRGKR